MPANRIQYDLTTPSGRLCALLQEAFYDPIVLPGNGVTRRVLIAAAPTRGIEDGTVTIIAPFGPLALQVKVVGHELIAMGIEKFEITFRASTAADEPIVIPFVPY